MPTYEQDFELEELRVDRNVLTCLPGQGGAFPRLRHLSAAHNQLSALPTFLQRPKDMYHAQPALSVVDDLEDAIEEVVGAEDLRTINLRANVLKGNIILGKYGLLHIRY